jgi:hypothetical protein
VFIGALFTIAKHGNSQEVPQLTNGLRNVVFIHNGILLSREKE